MSAGEKLSALVESDPDVLDALVNLYLTAYSGGAFTALINLRSLAGAPLGDLRIRHAKALADEILNAAQGDPAVMDSLAEGLRATLRGEEPEATIMESHAGQARP